MTRSAAGPARGAAAPRPAPAPAPPASARQARAGRAGPTPRGCPSGSRRRAARSPRRRPRHPPVRSRTAGRDLVGLAAGRAVLMIRLMTFAASSSGCAARTSAAIPATIGAAPLVPFHVTRRPSAETPRSSSLGADTPIVMPWVDASTLAFPVGSTPATVSTPGMVAGAPTRVVPLPRLPAATTTTTSFSNA